jgi:hypothetical protein
MSEPNKPSWRNPVRARLEAGEFVIGATITTNKRVFNSSNR